MSLHLLYNFCEDWLWGVQGAVPQSRYSQGSALWGVGKQQSGDHSPCVQVASITQLPAPLEHGYWWQPTLPIMHGSG